MHEGLPLSRSTTVGSIRIHGVEAGVVQLDGGAMFGVVPKPLWERRIPADPRNRIPLAMRCLLVEAPNALVLIDTGVGNKYDEKFGDIYGISNAGSPTRLEDGKDYVPTSKSIRLSQWRRSHASTCWSSCRRVWGPCISRW